MPDSSGIQRIYEIYDTFSQVPESYHKMLPNFNPQEFTDIPEFIEAWETCDLKKAIPSVPMAFDRNTGDLVGIIIALPDLFQVWAGERITRVNVDTAMVKKGYYGKGIFSALNNVGQLFCNFRGMDYFEGTTIWSNNSRAIDTIFPHCRLIRKHFVLQKRL